MFQIFWLLLFLTVVVQLLVGRLAAIWLLLFLTVVVPLLVGRLAAVSSLERQYCDTPPKTKKCYYG